MHVMTFIIFIMYGAFGEVVTSEGERIWEVPSELDPHFYLETMQSEVPYGLAANRISNMVTILGLSYGSLDTARLSPHSAFMSLNRPF